MVLQLGRATLLLLLFCIHLQVDMSGGAPIRVPDLRKCDLAIAKSPMYPNSLQKLDCCLPITRTISEFCFENYAPIRTKVRGPAHKANAQYIEKYNRAYAAMRALPDDDPRSFRVQANMHCAFCSGAYKQRGQDVPLQMHFSWLFLPWHRWFLFFHERILGSLIGDPEFALLYWNWDNQINGNTIPPLFSISGSAVYDLYRNPKHSPPALVRLQPGMSPLSSSVSSSSMIIKENLNILYQSIVTASTADMFMGGAYSEGIDFSNVSVTYSPLAGALEQNAHGGIHFWTGDPKREMRGDMGVFTTASRDPIFYAHHSNVDRLWEVWKSLPGGRRTNPTHPDFLDTEFLFYDEHGDSVKVKVIDALDNKNLGIKYKQATKSDNLWINFNPEPMSSGSQVEYARVNGVQEVERACVDGPQIKIPLGSVFTALVKREMRQEYDDDELEEVLLIQGLEMMREEFIHLRVFINLPQANESTPIFIAEYVGSSNVVPTPRASMKYLLSNVMLEIGDNVKRIGVEDEDWVVITIVVESDSPSSISSVTIQGLEIYYT